MLTCALLNLLAQLPESNIYVSPWKLITVVILFTLWVLFAQWVDKDTVVVNTFRTVWNVISMICGTLGGLDVTAGKIVTQEQGIIRVSDLENYETPKPHAAAIIAFIDAIENDAPVPVPPEETLYVMSILDGIYRSNAGGGAEVKLNVAPLPKPKKRRRK